MATTTTWSITYPTTANNITPLATHFANLANSSDSALTTLQNKVGSFRGLDSAKGAAGQEGRTYYSTDTNRNWFDNGTSWVSDDKGLQLIRPTSLSGCTLSSDGTIVVNGGATSFAVGGAFTSRFRRYRLEFFYQTDAVAGALLRLRDGGTNLTGTGYNIQVIWASGSSANGVKNTSQDSWGVPAIAGLGHSGYITFTNPALSATKLVEMFINTYNTGDIGITQAAGMNYANRANSYDGFYFGLSASAFAAAPESTFKLYGMA